MIHFKGTRFKVDLESFLSKHDIIYRSMPARPQDGLPAGNGKLGCLIYFPGKYEASISKIDVWDNRQPPRVGNINHARLLKLLKRKDINSIRNTGIGGPLDFPYPSPKICGTLKIYGEPSLRKKKVSKFEQWLSLYSAKVEIRNEREKYITFVSPHRNIIAVKVNCCGRKVIELRKEKDPLMGRTPLMGNDGRYIWVDYTFPDGFRYVMLAAGSLKSCEVVKTDKSIGAKFDVSSQDDFFCLLTVCTTRDSQDPLKAAKKEMENALRSGFHRLSNSAEKWWQNFWGKSFIDLSDDFLENLWYFQLYQLASTSRGDYAPGLFGLWNCLDNPPWHGDYHEVNEQIIYYPVFTSNHQELGEPFYETFFRMLPEIKKETRSFYGIDGAKYPHAMSAAGREIEVFSSHHGKGITGTPSIRFWYMQCASSLYAQIYWWHYSYTLDKNFLKKRAYPVIKECAKFYEGYLSKDADGKYYIYPSHSPEQGPWFTKNPTIDLAMIKFLLKSAIKASRELHVDSRKRKNWEEILENLIEYPQDGDTLLESSDVGKKDDLYELYPESEKKSGIVEREGKNYIFRHVSLLYPVYPAGEFDKEDEIFKRTFKYVQENLSFSDCASFAKTQLACCAARLGMGEKALNILYDLALSVFLKPNGFFSYNVVGFGKKVVSNLDYPRNLLKDAASQDNIMLEMGSCFVACVNEMLLQSYRGIIVVFPAIPVRWSVKFADLRAEGAFLVSSELDKGVVGYISIKSEKGGECRIFIPWKNEKVRLFDIDLKLELPVEAKDDILTFISKRGHTYVLERKKCRFSKVPFTELAGSRRRQPRLKKKRIIEECNGQKAGEKLLLYLGKP